MSANKAFHALGRSYTAADRIVFDANIFVSLFSGLEPPGSPIVTNYSAAFKNIRTSGATVLLDVLVLSEFVNVCARKEYDLAVAPGPGRLPFKMFRGSPAFVPIAQAIARAADQIASFAIAVDHAFSKWPLTDLLKDYATGQHDVNDQCLVHALPAGKRLPAHKRPRFHQGRHHYTDHQSGTPSLLPPMNSGQPKKLIEVALPLPEINDASAYDKMPGIGPHPKGIHHWWARLPLPTARAVLFASVVDDPSAHPEKFPTEQAQDAERERLFDIIRRPHAQAPTRASPGLCRSPARNGEVLCRQTPPRPRPLCRRWLHSARGQPPWFRSPRCRSQPRRRPPEQVQSGDRAPLARSPAHQPSVAGAPRTSA